MATFSLGSELRLFPLRSLPSLAALVLCVVDDDSATRSRNASTSAYTGAAYACARYPASQRVPWRAFRYGALTSRAVRSWTCAVRAAGEVACSGGKAARCCEMKVGLFQFSER